MRILRGVLIGAIAVATTAVLPPVQAMANQSSAPYNAFILDGGTGSYLLRGVLAFDAANSTITASGSATGISASVVTPGYAHWWYLNVTPPSGSTFVVGNTYPILRSGPTSTHGWGSISGDGRGCNYQLGYVTLHELTVVPETGTVTSLALSMSISCENDVQVLFTEVRYNSSIGIPTATPDTSSLQFGDQLVGQQGAEQTVTFAAGGSAASVFGAASVVEGNMFAISRDTCSNTTVPPGGGCTIGIRPNATAVGPQNARLKLPSNTAFGAYHISLSLNGLDPRKLRLSTHDFDFGSVPVGDTTAARAVTLTAIGPSAVTMGTVAVAGSSPANFSVSGDTCSGITLEVGQSCSISVVAHPTSKGARQALLAIPSNSMSAPASIPISVNGERLNKGTYYPLTPSRILDTREGNGAPKAPAGPGATLHLQVAGRGGVPSSGVSAVVLNVTVVQPTGWGGHITVFPAGQAKPTASSLNFVPGWTGANSVTVALGAGGQVDLFNGGGFAHLIADVVGFYALDNSVVAARGYGGEFQPTEPERLFDSREDWGEKLPSGYWVRIPVSYGDVYNPHIRALAVNVTAVDSAWPGYLTTFSGSGQVPFASTLNVTPGAVVPNYAVVPTSMCGDCGPSPVPSIAIYTSTDVHVIVDIIGFYDDGQLADGAYAGLRFAPQSPRRIVDSRIPQGMQGALGDQGTASITPNGLPAGTIAVGVNITAVSPTWSTYISVWPNGLPRPTVSTLNPSRGQIVPNAAVTLLGDGGKFNLFNNSGSVDIIVDLMGTFYFLPTQAHSGPSLDFDKADAEPGRPRLTRLTPQLHH